MSVLGPEFPEKLWDGLSDNPDRVDRTVDKWCNHQDWNRIVAEVISMQQVILLGSSAPQSIFQSEADETIEQFNWVMMQKDSLVGVATNNDGLVSGLSVTQATSGDQVFYVTSGKLEISDWTNTTGAQDLYPGCFYYLRQNGLMSSTPPLTGFIVQLGQAQTKQQFSINIQQSIKL